MSLEVKSNKELKKIKAEIVMGLGFRELLIMTIAGISVFILFIKLDIPVFLLCYLTAPVIAVATLLIALKPCGMYPEQFFLVMVKSIFVNHRKLSIHDERMEGVVNNVAKSYRKKGLHKN